MMKYKGFQGSIEYSQEDAVFHGQLLNVDGLVTYEADTREALEQSFQEAVDDYWEFKNEVGLVSAKKDD